ncbi:class I SAM-dependent methyltransferase [Acaryochloris marina]|uniref:Methyltransferase, putative n=1 Tax=Acaryochloris marina (strain MBIC 11017) TaxID=329726 RepID=B0C821_ACAM1|nr:class I SAM-dependent methyltransferase [Acaryochloris marina]ABW27705.1 methyltransferase, putative [Acaryochloris marina MBIC11017]BDM82439.1 hypothetical protein AM10699_53000 [Acaryochloris marina MBIC10699]
MQPENKFLETADIETSSDDYASRFQGPTGEWLLHIQEQATLSMLTQYPNASILDVGGGHGQLTEALINKGFALTVLGSSLSCQNRIKPYIDAGQCEFKVGDVLSLPYPDNTFDIVVSYRFLAHVNQWQAFLSELGRVAKTAVLVDYPTTRSINYLSPLLFKFKKGVEGNTRQFICYQEKELLDFCSSIGLEKDNRHPQFFWPMVLHRMLKQPKVSELLENPVKKLGLTYIWGSPVITRFHKVH